MLYGLELHPKIEKTELLGAGQEPYRQIGVDVNETQILDVAARAKVVKAQDLYSKMYREVGCRRFALSP